MEFDIDVLDEVLKKLEFNFIEERCGFQNNINCLIYRKEGNSRIISTELKVYFDRKNNKFITIHSNLWKFELNNFISENRSLFREVKLNKLLNENN